MGYNIFSEIKLIFRPHPRLPPRLHELSAVEKAKTVTVTVFRRSSVWLWVLLSPVQPPLLSPLLSTTCLLPLPIARTISFFENKVNLLSPET